MNFWKKCGKKQKKNIIDINKTMQVHWTSTTTGTFKARPNWISQENLWYLRLNINIVTNNLLYYIIYIERSRFIVTNIYFCFCISRSWGQCGAWATINSAGQDVPIISGNSERVVNLPIPALLVLEQKVRVVKCCELNKSMIIVFENAPFCLESGKSWQACSRTTSNHMYCSIQAALVIMLLFIGANVLSQRVTTTLPSLVTNLRISSVK